MTMYDPSYKYTFDSGLERTTMPAFLLWFHSKFPNLKHLVVAQPDNENAQKNQQTLNLAAKVIGMQVTPITYPVNSTDLSSVATKLMTLNADIFMGWGGGPQPDSLVLKAAHAAGWKGALLGIAPMPAQVLTGIAGADSVEGLIATAWPAEFDTVTNPIGKALKAAYTAKYGKWDDPEEVTGQNWWELKGALQQAGSTDPEKVAAFMNAGFKYDNTGGPNMVVPRPDLKLTRAIENIGEMPVKKIVNGKATLYDTFTLQQAYDYTKQIYGWP